jgi:two-component system chemotaxis response regulator CheB
MENQTVVRDTIVIGASAGGIDALKRLLPVFPADLPAALIVAMHLPADGAGTALDRILGRSSALPVTFATDGMNIESQHVYVAPPDRHLVVNDGTLALIRGPRENRARPAIDPLFRSAALQRRARVIGVILTGYLDDGAAGLLAVKRCGGVALVQDPNDAEAPSMPRTAAEALGPLLDGAYALEDLGPRLVHIVGSRAEPSPGVPPELALEQAALTTSEAGSPVVSRLGEPTALTCPECGGPLRKLSDGVERYRCYTGHGFTTRALLQDQGRHIERALWAGVRSMEERGNTLLTLARDSRHAGRTRSALDLEREAGQMREHAQALRTILLEQTSEP